MFKYFCLNLETLKFTEEKTGKDVKLLFEKMSKSKHNGVDPLEIIEQDGVDLTRLQLLDAASPKQDINWGHTQQTGNNFELFKLYLLKMLEV